MSEYHEPESELSAHGRDLHRALTSLKEEIDDAEVEISTILGHSRISLGDLLNLKPGDIVPCDFGGKVTVLAEAVPVFRGTLGLSRGQQAIKVEEKVRRPRNVMSEAIPRKA